VGVSPDAGAAAPVDSGMPDGATTDGATVVEGDAVVGIETDRAFATSPAMATMQIDAPTNHGDCTV